MSNDHMCNYCDIQNVNIIIISMSPIKGERLNYSIIIITYVTKDGRHGYTARVASQSHRSVFIITRTETRVLERIRITISTRNTGAKTGGI